MADDLVFHDDCVTAVDALLHNHTPTILGTAWGQTYATSGQPDPWLEVRAVSDDIGKSTGARGSARVLHDMIPAPTTDDQQVAFTIVAYDGNDDPPILYLRADGGDFANGYCCYLRPGSLRVYSLVAGVASQKASVSAAPAGSDVIFRAEGSTLTVQVDGGEVVNIQDTDHATGISWGLCFGNKCLPEDDIANQVVDNLRGWEITPAVVSTTSAVDQAVLVPGGTI